MNIHGLGSREHKTQRAYNRQGQTCRLTHTQALTAWVHKWRVQVTQSKWNSHIEGWPCVSIEGDSNSFVPGNPIFLHCRFISMAFPYGGENPEYLQPYTFRATRNGSQAWGTLTVSHNCVRADAGRQCVRSLLSYLMTVEQDKAAVRSATCQSDGTCQRSAI